MGEFRPQVDRQPASSRLERPPVDLYDRVFQEAFRLISEQEEFKDPESLDKVKKILNGHKYKSGIVIKWNAEDIAGGYAKDPEKQEMIRAAQVAEDVKKEARNKRVYQ